MTEKIKILAFGGSLRQGSFTRALLNSTLEMVPAGAEIEIFELKDIPMFNQDFEADPPEIVKKFKERIKASDAILISTPEYNYSVPGFLKNAIDWASRPYGDNSFEGKPIAIMGGGGAIAGSRAQYHLRQIFVFLNGHVLNRPEVMVPFMHEKIDKEGKVTDEHSRARINELLIALVAWTRQLRH